jgi:hypothetical protein
MRPSDPDRMVQTHPERRRPKIGGATARPHRRSGRAHLGLSVEAGGDAIRWQHHEGDLNGRGVVLVVAGGGWGAPHCSRTAAALVSSR